jgi:hypothetical protein
VKNGEKFADRNDDIHSETPKIGEAIDEVELLPVLHGEKVPVCKPDR